MLLWKQLAMGPTRVCIFPHVSLFAQTLHKIREDKEQILLVAPHNSPSLTNPPEARIFNRGSATPRGSATALQGVRQLMFDYKYFLLQKFKYG